MISHDIDKLVKALGIYRDGKDKVLTAVALDALCSALIAVRDDVAALEGCTVPPAARLAGKAAAAPPWLDGKNIILWDQARQRHLRGAVTIAKQGEVS